MSGVATLKIRGSKRHFDEMAIDLPGPTQACSPNRFPLRPPPLKRGRCAPSSLSTTPTPTKQNLFQQQHQPNHQQHSSSSSMSPSKDKSRPSPSTTSNNLTNANTNNSPSPSNANNSALDSNSPTNSPVKLLTSKHQHQHQQRHHDKAQPSHQQNNDKRVVVSTDDLNALARHLPRRLKKQLIERLASGQVQNNEKLFTLTDLREIVNSVISEHDAKSKEQFTTTLNERLAEQFRDFTKFNEDYVSRQLRGTDVAYLS